MRLVWVVIPLVFLGIVGFVPMSYSQESNYDKNAFHQLYSKHGEQIHEISKMESSLSFNESLKQLSEKFITAESISNNPLAEIIIPKNSFHNPYYKIDSSFGSELYNLNIFLKQYFTTETINGFYYRVNIIVDADEDLISLPDDVVILSDQTTLDNLSDIFPKIKVHVLVNLNKFSELDQEDYIIEINPVEYLKTTGLSNSIQSDIDLELLSPLQQMKNELEPHQVSCKENLVLLIKNSLTKSICVKSDSVDKLQKRGWI